MIRVTIKYDEKGENITSAIDPVLSLLAGAMGGHFVDSVRCDESGSESLTRRVASFKIPAGDDVYDPKPDDPVSIFCETTMEFLEEMGLEPKFAMHV